MTMTEYSRAAVLLPFTLAGVLLVSACGGDAGDDTAESTTGQQEEEQAADGEFNDADVTFARGMIPHHEQAVEMSQLAEGRASEEVQQLAEEIEAAQGPEIEQMTAMLESWGEEPLPADDGDHAEHGMAGMMTDEQMAELEQSESDVFDTLFLTMMIEHHEGAIVMAEDVLADGIDSEVQQLAEDIIAVQQAEIEQMSGMLGEDVPAAEDGDAGDAPEPEGDEEDEHAGH